MDDLVYREEILEHWQNPLNFGVMDEPDLVVEQVNPLCGDEVTFFFKFSKAENLKHQGIKTSKNQGNTPGVGSDSPGVRKVIKEVSFTGSGCAISMAAASMLSEAIKGKSLSALSKITGKDILKLLGGSIAPARLKCALLPLEAVKKIAS